MGGGQSGCGQPLRQLANRNLALKADLSRRILTDYGFEGHPLRKDFPLTVSGLVDFKLARKETTS